MRAVVATVAGPGLGVLRRVLDFALHHPGVEAGAVEPSRDPVGQSAPRGTSQLPRNWAMPPGSRCVTDRADEVGDDRVARGTTVAVLEQRHVGASAG